MPLISTSFQGVGPFLEVREFELRAFTFISVS